MYLAIRIYIASLSLFSTRNINLCHGHMPLVYLFPDFYTYNPHYMSYVVLGQVVKSGDIETAHVSLMNYKATNKYQGPLKSV